MKAAQAGLERMGGPQFAQTIFEGLRQTLSGAMSEIFLVAAGFSLLALLVVVWLPQLELRGKGVQAKTASTACD